MHLPDERDIQPVNNTRHYVYSIETEGKRINKISFTKICKITKIFSLCLLFWWKIRLLWFTRLHNLLISGYIAKKVWIKWAAPVVPLFSLQWKSNKSTNYLPQMLLAINWHYWHAGKKFTYGYEGSKSLQANMFIEIH